jgi:hypothetical protein
LIKNIARAKREKSNRRRNGKGYEESGEGVASPMSACRRIARQAS